MIPDNVSMLFSGSYDYRIGVKILGSKGGGYVLCFTDDPIRAASLLNGKKVLWLNSD